MRASSCYSGIGNAPEDAERLDCARAFDRSHIRYVEPELIEDGLHVELRAVMVAADELVGLMPLKSG